MISDKNEENLLNITLHLFYTRCLTKYCFYESLIPFTISLFLQT